LLKRPEIENVADFVRSLSKLPVDPKANLALGAKVFADNCASCHGEKGQGNREFGAPNLTDGIWLYGSGREAIVEVISNGRSGVMPAWAGRLDDTTIKALTVYVHTFGGGEK
jgi:cytochrome c oxidase cbb3-type subunit 3